MKRWGWAGLAARVLLGCVLVFSGASKRAAPPEEFQVVIEAYDLVPLDAARTLSRFLPWIELAVGFSLLLGFETQLAALAGGAMMATFVAAILSTKARGMELPNCGCFGGRISLPPLVTAGVDTLLIAAAALAFKAGRERLSLDNWASGGYTERAHGR